jgi:hypothetical protein
MLLDALPDASLTQTPTLTDSPTEIIQEPT